jgi:hypothetical protein
MSATTIAAPTKPTKIAKIASGEYLMNAQNAKTMPAHGKHDLN